MIFLKEWDDNLDDDNEILTLRGLVSPTVYVLATLMFVSRPVAVPGVLSLKLTRSVSGKQRVDFLCMCFSNLVSTLDRSTRFLLYSQRFGSISCKVFISVKILFFDVSENDTVLH